MFRLKTIGILVFVGLLALTGCDFPSGSSNCKASDETEKARLALATKQIEFNIQNENNLVKLRMRIVEQCVSDGRVPELAGGNVTCNKK
jgi:hypothetical protein